LKSEATKGLVRIGSNYARLGVNLVQGLIFLPFVFNWLGNEPVGLIGLLGPGTGMAGLFREISDRTMIRELGAAYHAGDDEQFRRLFNSAMLLSLLLAAAGVVITLAVLATLPFLKIEQSLQVPAVAMVITGGAFFIVLTALSPIVTMMVIRERFIRYNLWTIADRSSLLVGALIVRYALGIHDPARALTAWCVVVMLIQLVAVAVPVTMLLIEDPRLRPRWSLASRKSASVLFGTARWYLGFGISENMWERAGALLSNIFLGLQANAVFYAAVQLVAYISQLTMGISQGLDSVSARLESKGGRSLKALIFHSTRLLGLAAIPAGVAFFILAPELVRVWIGKTLKDPDTNMPLVVVNARIMCLPLVVRSVAVGWTGILYGAGFLRRYAPTVLYTSFASPALMVLALLIWPRVESVSALFALVYTGIYFVLVPRVGARCLGLRVRDLFTPMLRPAAATALCTPVLLLGHALLLPRVGPLWTLGATGAAFGACYATAAALLVLTADERERFMWAPLRRIAGRRARSARGQA
jgi:O-antigen/teichoic acid export membrane protein